MERLSIMVYDYKQFQEVMVFIDEKVHPYIIYQMGFPMK